MRKRNNTDVNVSKARKNRKAKPAEVAPIDMMALEPRYVFDGAAAATLVNEAQTDAAQADIIDKSSEQSSAQAPDAAPQAAPGDAAPAEADIGVTLSFAPPASATPATHAIIFIDARVPDLDILISDAPRNAEIVLIDTARDGLDQVAEALKGRQGLFDAIHIISHGQAGRIEFGSQWIDAAALEAHAADLAAISAALTSNGDLLLYGCDVAAGPEGAAFAQKLAELTGADVAASTDDTGAARLGGDWTLESQTGSVESGVIVTTEAQTAWDHLMAAPVLDLNGANAGVNYADTMTRIGDAVRLVGFGGSISDADVNLTQLKIVAAGVANGASESLNIAGQKFVFGTARTATASFSGTGAYSFDIVYDGANTFTITRTGGGSWYGTGEQNTFLRAISYTNDSNAGTGTRTFTFTATDATAATATATSTVTIAYANTAPIIGAPSGASAGEVAAYSFENATGNAPSTISGGPTMNVGNGATYSASASRTTGGYGLSFPGGTGNSVMAGLASLPADIVTNQSMTVSGWIRFDSTAAWQRFIDFSTGTDGNNNILIGREQTSNNLVLQVFNAPRRRAFLPCPMSSPMARGCRSRRPSPTTARLRSM